MLVSSVCRAVRKPRPAYENNSREDERVEDRFRHDGRRVPAHDGDDLVSVHLQTRVEPHHDVIRKHSERFLEYKQE